MTLAKLRELVGEFLVKEWQVRADLSDERLQSFLDHGIPEDWAQAIASVIPTLPVSVWPKLLHPPKVLHARKRLGTVKDMTSEHALAISKTQRGKDRKFRAALHAADYTQNSLAEKLGISSASLTRYRDKRPVPRKIAEAVKYLIHFDGTWPGGIVD